jgi:recombination protein RecR
MSRSSNAPEIERLISLLARLPGLGPRSARRAVLHLLKQRDSLMHPLAASMTQAAENIGFCPICGNIDAVSPCSICADESRDRSLIVVVEEVGDLWALERSGATPCLYHVLGGVLSPLDGVGPEDLNIARLFDRARADEVREVLLALNATIDGQSTIHFLRDELEGCGVKISQLAHGVPVGGELDYLDEGTISAAIRARRRL